MNRLILTVAPNGEHSEELQASLDRAGLGPQARRVHDVPTALARLAGGGVGSILMEGSVFEGPGVFNDLHSVAPGLPVFLWSEQYEPSLASLVKQTAASGYLTQDMDASEWKRLLVDLPRERELARLANAPTPSALSKSTLIAVTGAKGGVGTTTVAMNIAAALAERGSVILAEIRSSFGSLQAHFYPGRAIRGLTKLGESTRLAPLLWPVPSVAGLRILFGPQTAPDCHEIDAEEALNILNQLAPEADFVVLDLPVALTETNRAILGACNYLAMVVEPTPACLRLGKLALEGIQSWTKTPPSIGAVVVKRRAEGTPMSLSEIENDLGVALLRVIPPAPELCILSEQARVPLVQYDPESLVTDSLLALARCFHSARAFQTKK
jgi:pilus assembly protein CpaE